MAQRKKMPPRRDVAALLAFIDSRQNMPHAWGRQRNDCVSFALGAVKAQTGRGRASDIRWSSKAGAAKAIAKLGGLEAAIDHYFVRIPPALAQRGDIAGVADPAFGIHPMIVEGETLVCPGQTGNRRAPRRMMVMAWSAVARKKHNPSPSLSREGERKEGRAPSGRIKNHE